jgi:hypothetical protein
MADQVAVIPPKGTIEGVKTPVALKIFEMLKGGRRYFGSAGSSLTHLASNPDYVLPEGFDRGSARIGLEGERETSVFLRKWIADKPNAVLIDSVHIRGWGQEEVDEETGLIEGGDTDHILIIGSEVLLIDTKRWKKKSNYQVSEDGSVLRANKPFPGGGVRATAAMHMWLDYLDSEAKVTTFICINSPDITVFRNRNWYTQQYRLVEIDRFEELLNAKYEKISAEDRTTINSTLVSQIAVGAVKPYDEYQRVFSMDALKAFKG